MTFDQFEKATKILYKDLIAQGASDEIAIDLLVKYWDTGKLEEYIKCLKF